MTHIDFLGVDSSANPLRKIPPRILGMGFAEMCTHGKCFDNESIKSMHNIHISISRPITTSPIWQVSPEGTVVNNDES
jgi:hypothetical protein